MLLHKFVRMFHHMFSKTPPSRKNVCEDFYNSFHPKNSLKDLPGIVSDSPKKKKKKKFFRIPREISIITPSEVLMMIF